ncbi:Metalloprotease PmbA [Bacteroides pyogenes]|uniref:TldD/PmbA family protein n=1 Tax=Bacteroides pyogenes TaxID=310300 RepID=A0A5D3EA30_9BACE|nr:TldD/PmbA family protein [Bacteroides pyogenes]MBR8721020.1 Metalloprotease PmbA [Bacteroides pyogenes]MBR8725113.1 Metalloprotease PmbA [Bacteroides pyogenes]MBR8738582.1 Metalloprotease PmbA [Bacteroides pyogenes]MBR8754334.1 Metalloprotease PmbA [Bacteroides pyogenes]MBR8787862.1 Metalloprotease PmbA [Bacteroides pyogenes]
MITDNNKKLAQWAMDYALRNGCQAAKVLLYSSSNTSFELRDAKMETLQQATEGGLNVSLYVDGRYGSISTNRLDRKELETFIKNGIDSTRYLAEDKARVLPDPERYYKGGKPDLQLSDSKFSSIDPDDKVALAKAVAEEAMGKDDRVISVSSSYNDGENAAYRLISNGFEGETKNTWYSLSASVTIKGEGEARPSSYWYESSLYIDDLIKKGIGQKALERVLRKLGQKKVQSGKYTMVVDPMNTGRLLGPLMSALNGGALQQKNSFLLNKLHEKVGSDRLTLTDDPHLVKAFGARYFDNEGIATERRAIFDRGVLNTYFIDTYNAGKMEVDPTISSASILVMNTGNKNLEGLVADIDKGILVTGFNGGNCNSSTGDFSYGIEGFLIEGGKLTQPVSEMNITGNMITLWSSLVETGNDPRLNSSWRIPSLVFEGVDFSGL